MYRSHTCGELNLKNKGQKVTLSGWVHKVRDMGAMCFIDLRDRYGVTQITVTEHSDEKIKKTAASLGREFVIQVEGDVVERSNKNHNIPTGEIEISAQNIKILSKSEVPPFTIEDLTDGGDELRMKFRYLDIRRKPVRDNLILRSKINIEVRNYLAEQGFIDIETPYLIKSTPEGARDFVVPSRMNEGEFYALPQSPQTFKQLLMVGGIDKYYQIVKCFRDEDLRADRQPEFTQIDCEMSFVEQEDILNTFEGLFKHLLDKFTGTKINKIPRITYNEAMSLYGSDKPDIRFEMKFKELNEIVKGHNFKVFDDAELIIGICAPLDYSRKQIDELIEWIKRPQIGASGLVWIKISDDNSIKSSVDKFYSEDILRKIADKFNAQKGDTIFIMAGDIEKTQKALGSLRLELGQRLGLRDPKKFAPLWVIDFPLLEWNEESKRYHAMHHPFTSPKLEDISLLESNPAKVRANAYDIVLNGNEIGGGSIRIHDSHLQSQMFKHLGFSEKQAEEQFGFLINAFKYGAPPHAGIAFGFDRLVAILGGNEIIRDFIAFPKNNSGRDVMIDAPAQISDEQLKELGITKCN